MTEKTSVLFVCLGNIVRSPLAENLFRQRVEQAGLADQFTVYSAGTSGYHVGESPDSRMRQVAAQRGLTYSGRSRQFWSGDFEAFDWIIAMDDSNRTDILRQARSDSDRAKVRLMREFDPQADGDMVVPDPYYGGIDGFHNVYDIVERATGELFDHIQSETDAA